MLTSATDAADLLKQSFDRDHYDAMYRRMRFAMGHTWDSWAPTGNSGDLPSYPDVRSLYHKVGVGNNIIIAQTLAVESAMYAEPRPEFPRLNEVSAEVRAAWFLARRNGMTDWLPDAKGTDFRQKGGGWAEDDHFVVTEGDGVGLGILQIGLETGESGLQRLTARHSPRLYTLGDRSERNPAKWRHIAFIDHMAFDHAVAMFGRETAELYATESVDNFQSDTSLRVVPIIDYYDCGTYTNEPTHMMWAGSFCEKPFKRERNKFDILPFSYYASFWMAGMQHPTGRIEQQMPLEAVQQEFEQYLTSVMRFGKGFTLYCEQFFNEDDLKALKEGLDMPFIRLKDAQVQMDEVFKRVEPMTIRAEIFQGLAYYFRKETMASGVNEMQRGVEIKGNQTLGEVKAVQQESSTPAAWMAHRLAQYYRRTVQVACHIGGQFDRAPVMLDVLDAQVPFNVIGDPQTDVRVHLKDPTQTLISEDQLRYRDQQNEKRAEIAEWMAIANMQMQLQIDPGYLREKILTAKGEKDPQKAALQMPQQPMDPLMAGNVPGLPGQQQPNVPA